MKTSFLALAALFAVAGVFTNFSAITKGPRKTEEWLVSLLPSDMGAYKVVPKEPGGKVTYRMDPATYEELDPVGIAAQRFEGPGGKNFEAVVVAGDGMRSFHDQRWCFHAQGWEILEEGYTTIHTQSYGDIPVALVKIGKGQGPTSYAIFTFKGPKAFHSTVFSLSKDYFVHELTKQQKYVGYEYRFIPGDVNATKDELIRFACDYIDRAHQTSGGVM